MPSGLLKFLCVLTNDIPGFTKARFGLTGKVRNHIFAILMKNLLEEIAYNEQQLILHKGQPNLQTHHTLTQLYNFVDSAKVNYHANIILKLTESDPQNNTRLLTRLSLSRSLTSNRKIYEARKEVDEVMELAKSSRNAPIYTASCIYRLFLCPFGKEMTLGRQIIAQIEASSVVNSDAALKNVFHQASADFLREQDIQAAIVELYHALAISQKSNMPWQVGVILCKLGIFSELASDLPATEKYYAQALPLLKEHGCTQYVFQVQVAHSKLKINQALYEEAVASAEEALHTASSIQFKSGMEFALNHKITALLWMKRISEAEELAVEIINNTDNNIVKGVNYNILSNIYVQKGEIEKAIECSNLSYDLKRDTLRPQDELAQHDKLYKLHKRIGKHDEALHYLELVHQKKTELMDEARAAAVTEMQAKYETEKKEAELREARLQQTESELKALKAQMNPHFIFNALNSIQEIFFLGEKRLANKHLSRFSMLMRNILKASGKRTITLHEEITMLQEYLALESLRFGEHFSTCFEIEPTLDVYTIDVPPMIIQPFVENAVKHGLMHKDGNQMLELRFCLNEPGEKLLVVVKDNGIGRKSSAQINQNRGDHESFSTSATLKRFEMLNLNRAQHYTFHYIDLENTEGHAAGTEVYIEIPLN